MQLLMPGKCVLPVPTAFSCSKGVRSNLQPVSMFGDAEVTYSNPLNTHAGYNPRCTDWYRSWPADLLI